jgi:flagellar biosynthetic protein FliQ
MSASEAVDITHAGLLLVLTMCGPLLLAGLIIGVAVSLFQAVTQIQEQTLTFVPKLVIMGVVLLISLPMMGHALGDFMTVIADHIVHSR